MDMRPLGRTGLSVPICCLGTMTWGQQNSEAEAHAQLDLAFERGVNFLDTAELYPVPRDAKTFGATERFIGSWLAARGRRDDVVIATKMVGLSTMDWFRPWDGPTRVDARNVDHAVEGSLKRLQTDVIDLYQIHWPDRQVPLFGSAYAPYPDQFIAFADTLEALQPHVEAGRIRHIGVSNETSWGVMQFVAAAEAQGLPRIASIQNAYNLLNRTFEDGLAEIAIAEDVGLLAYSPLGFGYLTGKHLAGPIPAGSRLNYEAFTNRYASESRDPAIRRYLQAAGDHGLTPEGLALKFCATRPFMTSVIIGATSQEQLTRNLDAFDAPWTDDLEAAVAAVHKDFRSPCP